MSHLPLKAITIGSRARSNLGNCIIYSCNSTRLKLQEGCDCLHFGFEFAKITCRKQNEINPSVSRSLRFHKLFRNISAYPLQLTRCGESPFPPYICSHGRFATVIENCLLQKAVRAMHEILGLSRLLSIALASVLVNFLAE